MLVAMFPTAGILLLNGYLNGPLYRASPPAFWALDFLTHLVVPAALLTLLSRRYRVAPAEYGLGSIGTVDLVDFFALSIITTFLY